MLCHVCKGSGWLLVIRDGDLEYWHCPCCGGAGATVVYNPPLIGKRGKRGKGRQG